MYPNLGQVNLIPSVDIFPLKLKRTFWAGEYVDLYEFLADIY